MSKFLETYILPVLNHEEIKNINWPITSIEIESEKKFTQTKVQNQLALLVNSTKYLKKS